MIKERVLEMVGILMIGDGIVAVLDPERHGRLWLGGPALWQKSMHPFVRSRPLMRSAGLAEALLGLLLASRQRATHVQPQRLGPVSAPGS